MTGPDLHCNQAARPFESLETVKVTGVMDQGAARDSPQALLGSGNPNGRVLCLYDQLTLIRNAVSPTEPELATDV